MRTSRVLLTTLLSLAACGGSQAPAATASVAPEPSASTAPAPVASTPALSASVAAPAPSSAPAPAGGTAEGDPKKAEALRQLAADRATWQAKNEAEIARFTPQMHAAAKALADRVYPTGRAALAAAIAGDQRRPGNAARDKYRHPLETLTFFGFKPTLTVLEVSPGEGWYTEILAPALAAKGKLIVTTADPNGPADQRSTFSGQSLRAFLDNVPEVYGKVETRIVDDKAPALGAGGSVDLVLLMREVHGMANNGVLDAWLAAVHDVLRDGGVLGIEEHRAKPGADPVASAKTGYVPEKWLIEQVESAGFELAGRSHVNDNAKDTKDYPEGVWTLPPSLRLGDKDRAKYLAIGESDRMTLKFVKIAKKN